MNMIGASSAYHNWTLLGDNANYHHHHHHHRQQQQQHPDVTIAVGNAQQQTVRFLAHKCVLSGYSGYFKTLFSSSSCDGAASETRITNIGSHTFGYLLSFMYTGYLQLNPLNVYEIFLASDLLHITEALALCKQYLAQKHSRATADIATTPANVHVHAHAPGTIIKPIPRRKVAAVAATAAVNDDQMATTSSYRRLKYQPLRLRRHSDDDDDDNVHDGGGDDDDKDDDDEKRASRSVFKPVRPADAPPPPPQRRHHHNHHHHHHVEETKSNDQHQNQDRDRDRVENENEETATGTATTTLADRRQRRQRRHRSNSRSLENSRRSKTPTTAAYFKNAIVDVACCDGPIKFHRVPNKYYDPRKAIVAPPSKYESAEFDKANDAAASAIAPCHGCERLFKYEFAATAAAATATATAATTTPISGATTRLEEERDSEERTNPNIIGEANFASISTTTAAAAATAAVATRQQKKKTENMRCYRCKTCGSKFPSYYFVHKHRKLHHRHSEDLLDD